MAPKMESLISGTPSVDMGNFIEFALDNNQALHQQEQVQQQSQDTGKGKPIPNTTDITPPLKPVEKTMDDDNLSPDGCDITKLLDEVADNIRDISVKVGRYNSLMEKTHIALQSRYNNWLSDENIENLKNFLTRTCNTSKQYQSLFSSKRRIKEDYENLQDKKKRKLN